MDSGYKSNMVEYLKGAGDPEGKRLARRQAESADEACRVAECLAILLRRSGLPDAPAIEIAKSLRITSVQLRRKCAGRIEPRLTIKNTSHPLHERRQSNHLYLDESGTASIFADDKVFALGGAVLHEEHVEKYVNAAD